MKKVLSLILALALLLSTFTVAAFAADGESVQPTVGPWDGVSWMTGGPMINFYDSTSHYVYHRQGTSQDDPIVTDNEAVPGATYDKETNTLTIRDVKMPDAQLEIYYMGDDFKLRVEGECELGFISVRNYFGFYSTSLNITGTGALSVNKEKNNSEAMYFYADGKGLAHLDIAPSVTVHLYAKENASEQLPQHIMRIWSSYLTPEDGGAITSDSQAIPEAKNERKKDTVTENVNAVWVDNTDKVYDQGKRVKSKSDPEGIYAVKEIQYSEGNGFETRYGVTKFNYDSTFDMYLPDPDFADQYYDYKMLTKDEFEAGYDYVLESQPKKIRYTSDYREKNRGYRSVKMIKADDPDGIYLATDGWNNSWNSNGLPQVISTYYVYRAHWDEGEQLYVQESSYIEKGSAEALAEKGYTVATEEVERRASMNCWVKGAPYDSGSGNRQSNFDLVTRSSDPDGMYVYGGTYSDRPLYDESGVVIYPVVYDGENDEYYLPGYYGGTVGADLFHVKDEDWTSEGCDFAYKVETVEQRVELQYVTSYYSFEDYSNEAFLLTKDGESGKSYCAQPLNYSGGRKAYQIYPIEWREEKGHYYVIGNNHSNEEYDSLEAAEAAGYHQVYEPQPVTYTTTGAVKTGKNYTLYQDDSNNSYFSAWYNNKNTVFSISDSEKWTYGGTEYYIGSAAADVNVNDLHDLQHEEIRDDYMYWIEGTEYHHIGTGEEPAGFTVSGTVTSFLSNTDEVTVELIQNGSAVKTFTEANAKNYSFTDVPAGSYTLRVSKKNHVTRDYEITVSADTTQNVKICPKGDVSGDGKVTSKDSSMAFQKAQGKLDLNEYQIKCGDVVRNDNKITSNDASRIFQHAQGKSLLW